jgi:leucyl-tRNA synthetase
VSASLTPSEVEAAVRSDAQTAKYLAGGTVAKVIVVPGRIVNVVVKPS